MPRPPPALCTPEAICAVQAVSKGSRAVGVKTSVSSVHANAPGMERVPACRLNALVAAAQSTAMLNVTLMAVSTSTSSSSSPGEIHTTWGGWVENDHS